MKVIVTADCTPYREMWDAQKEQVDHVRNSAADEMLFITEHYPVYTIGFHGDENNMLADHRALTQRGVELIRIERGGDITFHGPGQIVVYPIINLNRRNYGVKSYVHRLEQAVMNTCLRFGLATFRVEDATGVWCGNAVSPVKICAIGVKVSHGVTYHGLALNVTTDLAWFDLINPCGFNHNNTTSLSRELGKKNLKCPSIEVVKETIAEEIISLLGEPST